GRPLLDGRPLPGRCPGDTRRLRDDRRGVRGDPDARSLHQASRDEQDGLSRCDLPVPLLGRHRRPAGHLPRRPHNRLPHRDDPHIRLRHRPRGLPEGRADAEPRPRGRVREAGHPRL
ncbi:MAG: Na(+) H(+) antiporter subunit G, partial [uncultured Rubrobacteraceae bacterium]